MMMKGETLDKRPPFLRTFYCKQVLRSIFNSSHCHLQPFRQCHQQVLAAVKLCHTEIKHSNCLKEVIQHFYNIVS